MLLLQEFCLIQTNKKTETLQIFSSILLPHEGFHLFEISGVGSPHSEFVCAYGLITVPSYLRTRPYPGNDSAMGHLAAAFSLISTPRPGASLMWAYPSPL